MIILFAGRDDPPALPDLYIKDAESDINIPVAGNDGWDSDFLQAQTLCNVPLDFSDAETGLAALAETGTHWVQRKSKALLRVNFSDSGANAVVNPVYTDGNGIVSIGPTATITATTRQDGSAYMAPVESFDTFGATKIAFYVVSISAGTIDISVAGV